MFTITGIGVHDPRTERSRWPDRPLTGASGGIGRVVARYLARNYHARLVLTGRRSPDQGLAEHLAAIEAEGGRVVYVQADLTRPADAQAVVTAARKHLDAVDGLFHLAGVTGDAAMAVKRDGLLALAGLEPRLTVLFSSIAGLLPTLTLGLERYAEANRWLDDYARSETRVDRRVVSIAWPPWSEVGMAAAVAEQYRRRGLVPIAPGLAVRAMRRAIAAGSPNVAIMFRDDAVEPISAAPVAAETAASDLRAEVLALIAKYAEVAVERIRGDQHLMALGVDSLSAVDLVHDLEKRLGRTIPPTFLFEYDTVDAVIAALQRLSSAPGRPEVAARLALSGDSGRLPLCDSQRTFLVQQQYFPDLPCNVFVACDVRGADSTALDREQLSRALAGVVKRHSVLRSVVARDGGAWVQVLGTNEPTLAWVDRVDDEQVANQVLDLLRGPLLRLVSDGHRVALQAHHLLVDAWSAKLVVEEVLTAYASPLTELPAAASDWWSVAPLLQPGVADPAAAERWRRRLNNLPPLSLPWDGDVSAPPRAPARMVRRSLSRDLTQRLEALARRESVTLPALVLSGYAQLLFDLSGQHDVLVRVAMARRDLRVDGLDRVVGSFADSLPVRITLLPNEPPGALARRVQAELVAVRKDADAASSVVLAKLAERSRAGPEGLTPAGFSFVNLDAPATVGGLHIDAVCGASASGFTRLGLIGWVFDGRLSFSFNYLECHLERATVEHIADRIEAIFVGWAPEQVRIEEERRLDGELLSACDRFIERSFMPELSFSGLARGSAVLAGELAGPRIGILADPGAVGTLAIVASLRAGVTWVPLDPDWPDARIASVLDEARPSQVLVAPEAAMRARSLAGGLPVIPVDVGALTTSEPSRPVRPPTPRRGPAYITFTSGSTGRPKGVRVGEPALLTLLDWVQRMLGADEHDCFMQSSALAFGASLRQTFAPILVGARAVPLAPKQKKDPEVVLDALEEHRVTIFNCVPSLWSFLMDASEKRGTVAPLAALRWLLIGGEAVPIAYWQRWRRLVDTGPRVANLYGGAETIANVTWFEVPSDFVGNDTFLPIGWPRYGMRPQLEDSGELVVAGAIADGYLNDEPGFATDPVFGHCYRTGDLGRRTAEGALVFVGRRDHRVQIHGNRVELGEIEAVLCQLSGVGAARVDYDGQRLMATLEVRDGPMLDEREVRAFVVERLPGPMVPHAVRFTRSLERNATGKIVRPKAIVGVAAASSVDAEAPLEADLARIWRELLRLERLPGPDDDFFLLGGDSILAIEMVMRLEGIVGRRVSPLLVHMHHRLGQLAGVIGGALGSRAGTPEGPKPVGATEQAAGLSVAELMRQDHPLGPVQRGFWQAARTSGASPLWTARLPIEGPLAWDAFVAAVEWVQARHPILRTRFSGEPHRPRQRFGAGPKIPVQLDDLSALPTALRERALEQRHAEELAVEIPLHDAPLLRIRLCRLAPERHVLLATGHHIISDAHSAWIVLAEILEQCRATGVPRPPSAELGYAACLKLPGVAPDPFWSEYLGAHLGAEPPLEADRGESGCARLVFDATDFARLRRVAASAETSPFGLVYAATAQALLEALGTDSVVLATASAGRDADPIGLADAVGPFAFGLPVVARRGPDGDLVVSLHRALAHAASAPTTLTPLLGAAGVASLGRYFLSWLETPASARLAGHALMPRWRDIDLRFRTDSTGTALSIAALALDGLTLHVRGCMDVAGLADGIERRLREAMRPRAALMIYAPRGTPIPFARPTLVETVMASGVVTEVVLLPIDEGQLGENGLLREHLRRAIDETRAEVVALAGMLPSLTGLGSEKLGTREVMLTTGHAVTVVAMLKTVESLLAATGRRWSEAKVGVLGFGAVGQATLQLCVSRLGKPGELQIADPRFGTTAATLARCDLILGAASTGHVLDVGGLVPGAVVIDDSFPRSFVDEDAWARMERARDVLLLGGGMIDVGPLERRSPFPGAEEIRARFPARWLPGCHAEALLLALRPDLGATVGQVELRRASQVLAAVDELGWRAVPFHLGPREISPAWVVELPRPPG